MAERLIDVQQAAANAHAARTSQLRKSSQTPRQLTRPAFGRGLRLGKPGEGCHPVPNLPDFPLLAMAAPIIAATSRGSDCRHPLRSL